ncbi:ApbE family protein [uncultured Alphaproteobacteria bacterium]|uniref:FAD:protein FMN transferase n=1 Tax=uncultured Alphaproteobacteria bacterium TaxID=91750 RepID=A0A212J1C2_9PROT|nr:ApbE family protein [uncultured Alphaproteobacteria bacterium]
MTVSSWTTSAADAGNAGRLRLACIALAALLTACDGETVQSFGGPTMGSAYRVQYVADGKSPPPERLQAGVRGILDELDRAVSTYRADSDVARFNAAPAGTCLSMPASAVDLFKYARTLNRDSDGAFDVTLLPALSAWGFGPRGQVAERPSPDALDSLRGIVGMAHVRLSPDDPQTLCKDAATNIEFNSIAAGYAVDRIVAYLRAQGVSSFLVDVTGELHADGRKPDGSAWRIALEAPISNARVAERIVRLEGLGVSTSGNYRNYFEENGVRYSHTLDPRTLAPVTHKLASVSVIAKTALEADGLSTLLMVLGPERGYDFAVEHKLAAFFVIKADPGVDEGDARAFAVRSTPEFEKQFPSVKGST